MSEKSLTRQINDDLIAKGQYQAPPTPPKPRDVNAKQYMAGVFSGPTRLIFRHGLGDHVQFQPALRQLMDKCAGVPIAFEGPHAAVVDDLCDSPATVKDWAEHVVDWHEADRLYSDSPSTKAEKFVREVLKEKPNMAHGGYYLSVPQQTLDEVAAWIDQRTEKRPYVLMHWHGRRVPDSKDLPDSAMVGPVQMVRAKGYVPVILDWAGKLQGKFTGAIVLDKHCTLWADADPPNPLLLAALAKRAALFVGIDSGPSYVAAAVGTRCLVVWTKHHPIHYFHPMPDVEHVLPRNHESLVRGSRERLSFFYDHYTAWKYDDVEMSLCHLLADRLRMRDDAPASIDVGDVTVDLRNGVAWQANPKPFDYGRAYWEIYQRRLTDPIGEKLQVERLYLAGSYAKRIVDVGIGNGRFVSESKGIVIGGYDVNPHAVEWLKKRNAFIDLSPDGPPLESLNVDGVAMFDVLEHVAEPGPLLAKVPAGAYLFVTSPIVDDLLLLKRSKHYKPDEHVWYFTAAGLIALLADHGFTCMHASDIEVDCGREGVKTFVFQKRRPPVPSKRPGRIRPEPTDADEESNVRHVDEFGGPHHCLQFVVPAGIGDVSWIYSKVKHLKKASGKEVFLYAPGDDDPRRSGPFIRLLPDVHWGGYLPGIDSWKVLSQPLPGFWPAKMGTWEFLNRPYVQNLSLNLFLEQGNKLADFWPWLPTDYHYPFAIPERDHVAAAKLLEKAPKPWFAVYVSNRDKEKYRGGGWSLWSVNEWVAFLSEVASRFKTCSFVFLGAEYDRDKTEAVASEIEKRRRPVVRVIAQRLGVAISAMGQCQYSFCYPSGIGILSNVLRVPGLMLLPWLLEGLQETYADPSDLASQRYRAWPMVRPGAALDWVFDISLPMISDLEQFLK